MKIFCSTLIKFYFTWLASQLNQWNIMVFLVSIKWGHKLKLLSEKIFIKPFETFFLSYFYFEHFEFIFCPVSKIIGHKLRWMKKIFFVNFLLVYHCFYHWKKIRNTKDLDTNLSKRWLEQINKVQWSMYWCFNFLVLI